MKLILFFLFIISCPLIGQQTSYFCTGGASKTLTASCSAGTAPYTYTWKSPAGVITNTASIVINNANQAGVWTWECTDATGCKNMGSHEIIFEPNPGIDIVINAVNSCQNVAQVVSATGVPAGYIYTWNFGVGAVPGTSTTPSTSVLWNSSGS